MRLRTSILIAGLLGLAACGGGGGGGTSPVPNSAFCGYDTTYQLSNPTDGSFISSSQSTFEIVASGNNNTIASSFRSFDLILVPRNANNQIATGGLSQVADPNGPHPYASDFYYSGQVQTPLAAGQQYSVYLNAFTSNCTPIGPIGTLFT